MKPWKRRNYQYIFVTYYIFTPPNTQINSIYRSVYPLLAKASNFTVEHLSFTQFSSTIYFLIAFLL